MSVIRITYLSVDGRYRRRKGRTNGDLPRHLLNGVDKQAHSLSESPVYVQSRDPLYLQTPVQELDWDHLTGNEKKEILPVAVPPPPPRGEGLGVLCEDGAAWPISSIPFTDPILRQMETADTHAEALALARARQARDNNNNTVMQGGFIAMMVVDSILVLVMAIVVLDARFGGPEGPAQSILNTVKNWLA